MLVIGAHPDDAEYHAGGLAAIYRQHDFPVKFISVTDGGAGHHFRSSAELIQMRRNEALASAAVIGAECEIWSNPDGALDPSLEVREQIIREIREYVPDLVLTHRLNDYHPDHRAVAQLVQDASYMVTVPLVVPDQPALRRDPVVMYMCDLFTRPNPLRPDVVVEVTEQLDTLIRMLACHRSQVFEWLPYNQEIEDQVPEDETERLAWLRDWCSGQIRGRAVRFRDALVRDYGEQRGHQIEFIEAYEASEYASPLDEAARMRLFPFLP